MGVSARLLVLFICFTAVPHYTTSQKVTTPREISHPQDQDVLDFGQMMKILQKPRVLDRFKSNTSFSHPMVSTVSSFEWSDCGASAAPCHLKSLSLAPDPLVIPGNVTVSASGSLKLNLSSPLKLDLKIEKKVLFWIKIPCIDDIGSCNYPDLCTLLEQVTCPPEFAKYGLPCKCPIKADSYSFPDISVAVHPVGVPSWLTDGDYKITATVTQEGKQVACIHLDLSITK